MNKTSKDHGNRITEAENTILLLKSLGGSSGSGSDGKPGFLDALETLVDNLRRECYDKFAERDDFNNFKKRIDAVEKHLKEVDATQVNTSNSLN